MTVTIVLATLSGVAIGWIASYFLVVRKQMDTIVNMRYEGFKLDKPERRRRELEVVPLLRNET